MKVLTFDIEDWFHLLDYEGSRNVSSWRNFEVRIHRNMDMILSLMDEKKLSATFFCLGWVADKYPEIIKEIISRGHEVGSHTYSHQLIFEQTQREFRNDLELSVKVLEDVAGQKVVSFRAPGFSITEESLWAFDALIEMGIEYDSSIFPARRGHGGIKDFNIKDPHIISYNGSEIKEFPISIKNLFGHKFVYSGGGYFRIFPYWFVKNWTSNDDYVMTYFHPRDFDRGQPVLQELPIFRMFKSYVGLKNAFSKFSRFVEDFEFVDIATADKQIDWSKASKESLEKLISSSGKGGETLNF